MNEIIQQPKKSLLARIWAFPLAQMILGMVLMIGTAVLASMALAVIAPPHNSPLSALSAAATAVLIICVYKGYRRWVERSDTDEFSLRGAPQELGAGLFLGFAIFSAAAGIVILLGNMTVEGVRGFGQFWSILSMAIFSGVFEEALFRGVIQRHMQTMVGTWGALAFTSGLFGLAHILNPDATWWASLAIAIEAGLMLGAAFLLTKRLWLAVGIHAAWNFTQGWVFSLPVSGGDAPLGLLITHRNGPDWITGGKFGLEASMVTLICATALGIVLLRLAIRRNGIVPPMWRRVKAKAAPQI